MIETQALVESPDPSALAAALASRLRHEFETEWSAEAGFVKLAEGTCTMHAWPEGLRLDAGAANAADLGRIERFIAEQLEPGGVHVAWRRRPLSEIPR